MYLLIFSVMLLFSALNLKAQQAAESALAAEAEGGGVQGPTLFFGTRPTPGADLALPEEPGAHERVLKPLLDDRESAFFESLQRTLRPEGFRVMTKVNVDDVLGNDELSGRTLSQYKKAKRGMERQHIDFVICRGNSLEVHLVVRLHPLPGIRPFQRLQMRRIDSALKTAGIPVLLYPPADQYDEAALLATVMAQLPEAQA